MDVKGALEQALEWYVRAADIEMKMLSGNRLERHEFKLHDTCIREARAIVDRYSLTLMKDAELQGEAMRRAKRKRPPLLPQGGHLGKKTGLN